MEMQVALDVLFKRLPASHFAEPPHCRDTFHFHGLEALRLVW
jgi:unspecific monooxygenase